MDVFRPHRDYNEMNEETICEESVGGFVNIDFKKVTNNDEVSLLVHCLSG